MFGVLVEEKHPEAAIHHAKSLEHVKTREVVFERQELQLWDVFNNVTCTH